MKKPWNRIDLPIYSLSTKFDQEENMNIATYVTSISMKPKRMLIAIYKNTKTLEIVKKNPHFVIQLLSFKQIHLVRLLGKTSGYKKNKIEYLEKKMLITNWNGFKVLKHALALLEVTTLSTFDAGDHIAYIVDVIKYKNINEGEPLTLNDLRKKRIISC